MAGGSLPNGCQAAAPAGPADGRSAARSWNNFRFIDRPHPTATARSFPPPAPHAAGRCGHRRPWDVWGGCRSGREPASRRSNPAEQLVARAQAEVFGQIGQDQPALAARRQMRRQPGEKAAQHAADRGRRPRTRSANSAAPAATADCRRRAAHDRRGKDRP